MDSFRQLSFFIGRLQSHIRYSSVKTIEDEGLHTFLTQIRGQLFSIGDALNNHYFANS